ncbi:hypothetical protein TCAL_16339 [Tigriopus californicus]|uniref:Uncharacterized protein n=1 Tax=Tigriopus californicus TaxID=6832 RepID=A0A553N732_TIGCA|nr:hypothetical protein TCAL_16339 [Tigriopus californicus]
MRPGPTRTRRRERRDAFSVPCLFRIPCGAITLTEEALNNGTTSPADKL